MLWKKEEVELLKFSYIEKEDHYLSRILERSPNAIRIKASRLGISKLKQREGIILSNDEEQVLLGSLMGDMHCRIRPWCKNAIVEEAHCKKQESYLLWKFETLKNLSFNSRRTKSGYLFLESRTYPCLNYYHELFYKDRRKTISLFVLDKIDGFGLAVWYMDDGYYNKKRKFSRLHTNCFSYDENFIIKKWFESKWKISPRIVKFRKPKEYPNKTWYYLEFGVGDTKKLFEIIKIYIHPSMKYKIGVFNEIKCESK